MFCDILVTKICSKRIISPSLCSSRSSERSFFVFPFLW